MDEAIGEILDQDLDLWRTEEESKRGVKEVEVVIKKGILLLKLRNVLDLFKVERKNKDKDRD